MKFKVVMAGCGYLGEVKHIRCLKQISEANVVAFFDENAELAEKLRKQYGSGNIYDNYQEMLKREKPDVVHISVPAAKSASFAVEALEAGCHVFLDKPMTGGAADTQKLYEAYKKSDRIMAVSVQSKFNPDVMYMKEQSDAGFFGEIYHADVHYMCRRYMPTFEKQMTKKLMVGGPMYDMGSHGLDSVLWLMNNYDPAVVYGKTYHKLSTNVQHPNTAAVAEEKLIEDSAFAFIEMKNGATIHLSTAWNLNIAEDYLQITLCGTKAGAQNRSHFGHFCQIDSIMKGLHINKIENGKLFDRDVNFYPEKVDVPGYKCDIELIEQRRFYDTLLGKEKLAVETEQSFVVQRILDAVYEADRTGKPVYF